MSKYISKEEILSELGGYYKLSELHGSTLHALLKQGYKIIPGKDGVVHITLSGTYNVLGEFIDSLGFEPDQDWLYSDKRLRLLEGKEVELTMGEIRTILQEQQVWRVHIEPYLNLFRAKLITE